MKKDRELCLMMRGRHLMICYQKVMIYYSCKKSLKNGDWILQISLWSFGSYKKENFTKRLLKYNLQNCRVIFLPNSETKKYGTDTIAHEAAQLWSTPLTTYKLLPSLDLFKSEIKSWHCSDCPCNTCRVFVDGVGFINWN